MTGKSRVRISDEELEKWGEENPELDNQVIESDAPENDPEDIAVPKELSKIELLEAEIAKNEDIQKEIDLENKLRDQKRIIEESSKLGAVVKGNNTDDLSEDHPHKSYEFTDSFVVRPKKKDPDNGVFQDVPAQYVSSWYHVYLKPPNEGDRTKALQRPDMIQTFSPESWEQFQKSGQINAFKQIDILHKPE